MSSSSSNSPIFIVGSERSGTTLLMAILGHHSRIAVPEVAWYYPRFRGFLHTYGDLSKPAHFRTLVEEMIFGLKTPFFGLSLNPATIVDDLLSRTRANTFAEAYRVILEFYAEAVNKPRWGEKTPHNLLYIGEILEDFPNAVFINLNRDGRDVAVEQIRSAFGPTNAYAAARIWQRTAQVAKYWRERLPSNVWLDVSYEALTAEPERVIREVTEFLGEEYEPDLLRFYEGETAQRRAQTKDHRPLGEPVSSKYVGIYRRYLSLYEQAVFTALAGDSLRELGYTVDVEAEEITPDQEALWLEWDGRVRAATLDAPEGHIVYESYNDWLDDQRKARKGVALPPPEKAGIGREPLLDWDEEFFSGQRAPKKWKEYFAIKRRHSGSALVL